MIYYSRIALIASTTKSQSKYLSKVRNPDATGRHSLAKYGHYYPNNETIIDNLAAEMCPFAPFPRHSICTLELILECQRHFDHETLLRVKELWSIVLIIFGFHLLLIEVLMKQHELVPKKFYGN